MAESKQNSGSDLFIVDNSDSDWKVRDYLSEWADIAKSFDIATGYFEIGALLALDGQWQKLEKLRILMGDEVSRQTKKALLAGIESIKRTLDQSIEKEKESNEFLKGVPAIVEALRKKQIQCRVYRKDKFHAKAYITHAKHAVVGPSALVGSSNLTYPGLTQNVELNVQLRREVEILQEWYERHWDEAEDITEDILKVIERHTREYMPFEVYVKALQEFFKGHEITVGEWELSGPENGGSHMYPVLDQYQKEGYQALMKIATTHKGAFLCDGVGLGKTFIGLMVIERLVMHDRKRVALFDPLSESWTHADGVIGNFTIGETAKGDLSISQSAKHLVVLEAKMFSKLSPGVTHAKKYDQAARNVACIAEVLKKGERPANVFSQFGFYVLAPCEQIEKEPSFKRKTSKDSIRCKVEGRIEAYANREDKEEKENWFNEWFLPVLEHIDIRCLTWEQIISYIQNEDLEFGNQVSTFYESCLGYNRSVSHRN